jgi:hypothetical protein
MHAASMQASRDRAALGAAAVSSSASDPNNALALADSHHGGAARAPGAPIPGAEFADEAGKRRRRTPKDGGGGSAAGGGAARITGGANPSAPTRNPWTANGHTGAHAHASGGGGAWWEQIQAADEDGYAPSGFKHLAVPTGFTSRSESPLVPGGGHGDAPRVGGVNAPTSLVDVSVNPYGTLNQNDKPAAAAAPTYNNENENDLVWGMTRAEARACGLLDDDVASAAAAFAGADVAATGPGGVTDPDLLFASLIDMGFAEEDAHDAAFRCSSLEAAVEAINNKTDPEFLRQLAEAEERAAAASAAAAAVSRGAGGGALLLLPANAAAAQAQAAARDSAAAAALAAADAADAAADAARRGGGGGGGDGWETVPRRNAGGATKGNVMPKNAVEVFARLIATKKARTQATHAHKRAVVSHRILLSRETRNTDIQHC